MTEPASNRCTAGPVDAGVEVIGIDVIVISNRTQAFGLELVTHLGVSPMDHRLLVLKSAQHFMGAFGPLAARIIRAQTGGCCPSDARDHTYANVARPLRPLDDSVEGRLLI